MTPPRAFIGIDVSKACLDGARGPAGDTATVRHDPQGIADLVERLAPLAPALIALEATGGLEHPAAALATAGHQVAVVNPRQARDFAKAIGRLAKPDASAADTLALFAERVRPAPRPLPDAAARAFEALRHRRRQLLAMRAAEQQRRSSATAERVRHRLQAHLDWLRRQLATADADLAQAMEASPVWRAEDERRQSTKGIGPVVARTRRAGVPELGRRPRPPIAALVGLAPLNRASGRPKGRRAIGGGRAAVRSLWYMAAWSAARYNPALRAFAARRKRAGKAVKVCLVAVARKLWTIANAVRRAARPWDPALARE